ncbi:N-methyl-L-tryptophan oxidase [Pallidibacillus thermolactis]|uniref:N-methyl-L-tryptophan oxidase n=1 Tax=Pallidibacillus thermolactis TaxID=251051 RepID=UPI0021DA4080|nr:N-methyl-L-tryptophan oxidase [Pallidibacillus thermolactis]MCU9602699.1 N-methyl-L-tryptophan oxidase [Pallidibacillus thermolactis subsp. kokeshiiformis]
MDADVGIIGVGTMGSMAAWQLSKRGVSVLGFEQFGIGNDRTAAGGESRLFRTAYMEGAEYVPLLIEAKKLWRELEKESGRSLLTLNGGLMIGEKDSPPIKAILESIDNYKLEHEILDIKQASKKYPQFKYFANDLVILDKEAGFIRPELSVVSATYLAINKGAKIKQYTTVQKIIPDSNGVTIIANGESYRVRKVVITTGAWTVNLLPELKDKLMPRRLLLTWFIPKNIDDTKPEKLPVFARMRGDFRLTGTPTLDGTMVKASFTKEPLPVDNPKELYRDVYSEEILKLRDSVETLLPAVYPDPVRSNAYMDAYTSDNHAVLGTIPGLKEVVIASGFSGHGFKLAPVIGKIISEIIIDGKTTKNIKNLAPERFVDSFHLI